jgi:response regulator RpfG family c-di-GMP phosphodiesterase
MAIPFIFLTYDNTPETIQSGREMGAEDLLIKPVEHNELVKIVHARLLRAAEVKIANMDQAYLETVKVLANTIEGRDPYTHGHVERVSTYAGWLAQELCWPQENLRVLEFGARLHDIGKIIVPDHILKKPESLTPGEWKLMKQHPEAGAKILDNINHLKAAIPYVLYHHERWDGSGYPHGLKGREIPLEGRLLAIVDVYDALTTSRPYHPSRPRLEVARFLKLRAGTHFDPDLVEIFVQVLEKRANG